MYDRFAENFAKESAFHDLRDPDACLPESLLLRLLSDFPGDHEIIDAMIARPSLPPVVVRRLADLLQAAHLGRLLARHPLPTRAGGEGRRRRSAHPAWWTNHLTAMFR